MWSESENSGIAHSYSVLRQKMPVLRFPFLCGGRGRRRSSLRGGAAPGDLRITDRSAATTQVSRRYISAAAPHPGSQEDWMAGRSWRRYRTVVSAGVRMRRSSIECNPGTVTEHKFAGYRGMRESTGSEHRPAVGCAMRSLKILGRIHTFDQFLKTYEHGAQNTDLPMSMST